MYEELTEDEIYVEDDPVFTQIPLTDASIHSANLAAFMVEEELSEIANQCAVRFDEDFTDNESRLSFISTQIKRLGLTIEELSEPFPGATPIVHPLVFENAVKMSSKIVGEVFNGKSFVDANVFSSKPETQARFARVAKTMDYQFLVQMPEYQPETEILSLRYAVTGEAFRKLVFDEIEQRPRFVYVPEDRFVISNHQKTLRDADFHTEIISMSRARYDALVASGFYFDPPEAFASAAPTTVEEAISEDAHDGDALVPGSESGMVELHEHHAYFSLPEGLNDEESRPLPYIVVREPKLNKIISIRRNWKEKDPLRIKRNWYAHYKFIPGLGFHGLGLVHILGNFQFALTQMLRSLIDAGQFANLQAGFRSKGVRMAKDSSIALRFGEWREIDTQQRDIREVLMPLQFKEPSQVLQALFLALDARAQKFADSTEQIIADSSNYGPVGTTVALLEASTKFINGILKRFYQSMRDEFRMLYDLNHEVLDTTFSFVLNGEELAVTKEDFAPGVQLSPAADPNISSTAHRLSIANAKLQAALQQPDIHNLRQAYSEFYEALGLEPEEIERLLPTPQQPNPQDPLTDIISATKGQPIAAFPGQDHDAHIAVKRSFLSDPQGGANPSLLKVAPIIEANIAEHQVLKYAERLKAMAPAGEESAQAKAVEFLLKYNQMEQTDLAEKAGDPSTLMALAAYEDSKTRRMEVEHRIENDTAKRVLEADKLRLEDKKIVVDAAKSGAQIESKEKIENKRQGARLIERALTDLTNTEK